MRPTLAWLRRIGEGLGVGGSPLGLPSLRCPLGAHGEQAVGESLELRGALSGCRWPGSEWRERRGAGGLSPGAVRFRQGKEAERGCVGGRRALGEAAGLPGGACRIRCRGRVKCGEDSLEGWGPGAPKP